MDVYKVTPANYCAPKAHDPEEFVHKIGVGAFSGTPMLAQWHEPVLEVTDPALLVSDFFYFGLGGLAFPARTREVFEGLFAHVGELLPFTMSGAQFFALNVLRRVDGLDVSGSEAQRLPNGKIVKITRYAFHTSVMEQESLFQIPEEVGTYFTVSGAPHSLQDFQRTYSERAMTGLRFDRVWSGPSL